MFEGRRSNLWATHAFQFGGGKGGIRGMDRIFGAARFPHHIVLFFLDIGALFAAIISWFAIFFTGHYPRSLFDYIEGVIRWHNRVGAYAFLLITDRYPPFSLDA
jgi:hypothetical protein